MVSTQTADFAALADRLAEATDAQMWTVKASADRARSSTEAILAAAATVRADEPAAEDFLDACGRALCAAGVFDRVMVSRVEGSTWTPLNLYRRTSTGRVATEIVSGPGHVVEGVMQITWRPR